MAAGDVFSGKSDVAAGAYLTIQPGSGVEAVIHNLLWDGSSISIEVYDGSSSLIFDTDSSAGGRLGLNFHVTNGLYLRVKNTHASATCKIAYDGVQTK